jgi:iron complex outermembrane receptor protein
LTGDFDITQSLGRPHGKIYHHKNKGAGNNWIMGWSKQGTTDTSDDVPVQIRDTRYTIDRSGVLGEPELGCRASIICEAGMWFEDNTSSAARYIWTNVKGPFSLAQYLKGQPDTAQWVQETHLEDAPVLCPGHDRNCSTTR